MGARKGANEIDRELDLLGEVCPYTFVKTKLTLEEMCVGELLRVVVDYRPATENVPRSVRGDGHKVLAVRPLAEGKWEIVIQKQER